MKRRKAVYWVETPQGVMNVLARSVGGAMHYARKCIGSFVTQRPSDGRTVQAYPQPRSECDGTNKGIGVGFVKYINN